MFRACRRNRFFNYGIVFTAIFFAVSGYVFAADTARIDPSGKVSVYQSDKKVDELSVEAPLPYDSMIECNEQCRVRMDSLYFVTSDHCSFSISAPPQDNLIQFIKGKYYFSLTELPRHLVIKTPVEDFTVQQINLQAAAFGGRLDGYIFVQGDTTEIGVINGGTMVISSSHGLHVVRPGIQFTVTQATGQPGLSGAVKPAESGVSTQTIVIGGLIGAAVIAGAIALIENDDDDNPPPASPSNP